MRSSPYSDCASLKYPTMVSRTLKCLCQGTNAAAKILISPKKYCPCNDGREIIDTSRLVGFRKNFSFEESSDSHASHIITNSRRKYSLVMSQPRETGLAAVLKEKSTLFRHL